MNAYLLLISFLAATTLLLLWRTLQTQMTTRASFSLQTPVPPPEPRTDADLVLMLRALSTECAAMLQRAGVVLQQQFACDELPVFVQRQGIRQLLANVVEVGCRAMHGGGTLKLMARADGLQAVVHFMDEYAGGEEAVLGRMFERASSGLHARDSSKDSVDAIVAHCQRIASAHGGRIYAAPSPLGELGLTLRLPLCAVVSVEAPSDHTPAADAA
ncbi:hypothetical protein WKW80_19675 [Variovorax humicola]|uniref:Uncharacterized protein n=1 Tax=Variovorax humicola TaxID=1769758 RepID=A0ABU8W4R6_9BURK